MLQMALGKFRLLFLPFGIALVTSPLWSQETNSGTAASNQAQAIAYTKFGIENGSKGDTNAAIAALDEAIRLDPQFAPAYFYRGLARAEQKNLDVAISDYDKAIAIDPNYKEALYQRGTLKGIRSDFDGAISDLKIVVKLDPKFSLAHYNLGHAYYFQGNLNDSLDQINQSINLQPNYAISYYIRGLIRKAQGQSLEATSDFQKAVELNFPFAAFWIWMAEQDLGRHGIAELNLTNAMAKPDAFKPDDWPTQIGNFLLGKMTQDQLIAKASEGDPAEIKDRLCQAWFYAGAVRHLAGDDKGARSCYFKAEDTDAKASEEYVEADRQLSPP